MQWLCKYGLDVLGLSFEQLLPSNKCKRTTYKHVNPQVNGLICAMYIPAADTHSYVDVVWCTQGELMELRVSHQGLKNYVSQLLTVLNRYRARMEWLQKGQVRFKLRPHITHVIVHWNSPYTEEHKYFGALIENKVMFLLDASSSMSTHWSDVKHGMKKLLCSCPSHITR